MSVECWNEREGNGEGGKGRGREGRGKIFIVRNIFRFSWGKEGRIGDGEI